MLRMPTFSSVERSQSGLARSHASNDTAVYRGKGRVVEPDGDEIRRGGTRSTASFLPVGRRGSRPSQINDGSLSAFPVTADFACDADDAVEVGGWA